MANLYILSDVGPGCANLVEDLRTVAALLGGIHRAEGGAGSPVELSHRDPEASARRISEGIRRFQKIQQARGVAVLATGMIKPGDVTMRSLNASCFRVVPPVLAK